METSKFKNMIVLKDLPSNLVEEAIVVLKTNKKVKNLEKIDKNINPEKECKIIKEKDYILKEAEMLVSSYIYKIENLKNKEKKTIKNDKKYVRLKNYAFITSLVILIQAIMLMIK